MPFKLTNIKPMQEELLRLRKERDLLIEALQELLRFESVMEMGADKLQYPDNFLTAINKAKELLNNIQNNKS